MAFECLDFRQGIRWEGSTQLYLSGLRAQSGPKIVLRVQPFLSRPISVLRPNIPARSATSATSDNLADSGRTFQMLGSALTRKGRGTALPQREDGWRCLSIPIAQLLFQSPDWTTEPSLYFHFHVESVLLSGFEEI